MKVHGKDFLRGAMTILAAIAAVTLIGLLVRQPVDAAGQAATQQAILTEGSIDLWQDGGFVFEGAEGIAPDSLASTGAGVQIPEGITETTELGVIGTAPITATVVQARIMVARDPANNTTGTLTLNACDGAGNVVRPLSVGALPITEMTERTWADIAVVEDAATLSLAPDEYLCWQGTRTAPGTLFVYLVIQATVQYPGEVLGRVYLPNMAK